MTAMQISTINTCKRDGARRRQHGERASDFGENRAVTGRGTHQDADEDLEDADRLPADGVSDGKEQEHVGSGDDDAGPEGQAREEQA